MSKLLVASSDRFGHNFPNRQASSSWQKCVPIFLVVDSPFLLLVCVIVKSISDSFNVSVQTPNEFFIEFINVFVLFSSLPIARVSYVGDARAVGQIPLYKNQEIRYIPTVSTSYKSTVYQCGNYKKLLLSSFFDKNFVKATFLLNKLSCYRIDSTKYFYHFSTL